MNLGSAIVITCSDRAAAGEYPDRSGPVVVEALRVWGFSTPDALVVPDDLVEDALRTVLRTQPQVVITCGGTGVGPRDMTPEATADLLDQPIPGIPEALRAAGVAAGVPLAVVSRGLAGMAGDCLVVNIAGSVGAARDAVVVLRELVIHVVEQRRGSDH